MVANQNRTRGGLAPVLPGTAAYVGDRGCRDLACQHAELFLFPRKINQNIYFYSCIIVQDATTFPKRQDLLPYGQRESPKILEKPREF